MISHTAFFRAAAFAALAIATLSACSSSPSSSTSGTTPTDVNGNPVDPDCTCTFTYNGDKRDLYCGQTTCFGTEEWACAKDGSNPKTKNAASCTEPADAACACYVTTGGLASSVDCGTKKCVGTSEVSCSSGKQSTVTENASACSTAPPCTCTAVVGGANKSLRCGASSCLSTTTKYSCPAAGGTMTQVPDDPQCAPVDYSATFTVDGATVRCAKVKLSQAGGKTLWIAENCTGGGVNHIWVTQNQAVSRGSSATNNCRLGSNPSVFLYDRVTLYPNVGTDGSYSSSTSSSDACTVQWTGTLTSNDLHMNIVEAVLRKSGSSGTKRISGGGLAEYTLGF